VNVSCPGCGETEELRGRRDGETIAVSCERCGTEWIRDPSNPSCARCGGDDIVTAPKALVEKSRGTQLSVLATTIVRFCRACDAEELEAYLAAPGGRLVMPSHLPTTSGDHRDDSSSS
jgi:hypothetical protein